MKRLVQGIVSVLGLTVAGMLIVPGVVDWNHFKAPITEGLHAFTGRQVTLEGDVRFSVLPVPTLSVAGVRIGNPAGAGSPDLLRLARLEARVALLPLFAGRIEVEHIVLDHPELRLDPLPDGRPGWLPDPAPPPGFQLPRTIRFDRVEIHDGTLVWRDDAQVLRTGARGGETRLTGLHARISASSLSGPFELVGRGEIAGLPLSFDAATGAIGKWASTPVRLALATLDGKTSLRFAGLAAAGDEPRLQGDLRAEVTGSLETVAAALGFEWPALVQPLSLHAALDAGRKTVSLTGIEFQNGDLSLSGNARLTLAANQPPALEAKLTAGRLDLTPWLTSKPGATPALAAPGRPAALSATLDLGVDALGLGPVLLRQAGLRARLAAGTLTLERLGALGPGGSEFAVSGTIAAGSDGAAPTADLRFDASADNLRMLLDQIGLDSAGVPGDRLRRAALGGRLRGGASDLQLSGLEIALDTSRITGQAGYRNQGRPAVSVRLDADHLDLDAYRAGLSTPDLRTLSARLDGLDLSLSARLGLLTSGGVALRGLELDASAEQGALTLRSVRAADLAGLALSLQGSIAGLEPLRGVDLAFGAETESIAGAERVFGLTLPPPLRRLGALKLGGHLAGDGARLAVALNADAEAGPTALSAEIAREGNRWHLAGLHGTLAGTALKGEGVLDLSGAPPAFDLRLRGGEIGLDRLWPETPRPALHRWSVEPLEFGWLSGVTGRLALSAAGITLSGRRLSGAILEAALGNGTLTLERLEGELMGGRLASHGRLSRGEDGACAAAASLTLTGARFEHGLLDGRTAPGTVDVAAGTLDLEATLTGSGGSELALAGSLAGSGRFAIGNGRLRGIDLPGLSQRIASLRQPQDVALRLSLGRGEPEGDTPFERLDGAFDIDHGIVTASGVRLAAEAGAAETEGGLDLPNRLFNLAIRLRPELLRPDRQQPLPPASVLITGSFDRPQRTIDTGALQTHLREMLLASPPP